MTPLSPAALRDALVGACAFSALLLLAALGLAGCSPPAGLTDQTLVSGFRVAPTFNAFAEPCDVRYTLATPALVQIRVTKPQADGPPLLVRQITDERLETAGARTAAWRGVGINGLFAPQGDYTVELSVRLDGSDRTERWALQTTMFRN